MLLMYTDPASVTGELVFAGYGVAVPPFSKAAYPDCPLSPAGFDEYAGIDVKDKTVVVVEWVPNNAAAVHSGCPASIGGRRRPPTPRGICPTRWRTRASAAPGRS